MEDDVCRTRVWMEANMPVSPHQVGQVDWEWMAIQAERKGQRLLRRLEIEGECITEYWESIQMRAREREKLIQRYRMTLGREPPCPACKDGVHTGDPMCMQWKMGRRDGTGEQDA